MEKRTKVQDQKIKVNVKCCLELKSQLQKLLSRGGVGAKLDEKKIKGLTSQYQS